MSTLIALGTIGFYIVAGIAWIIITALVSTHHNPKYGWATITLILFITALYYFGAKQFVESLGNFILEHPVKLLSYIIAYLFIGTIWSFAEWYWFVNKKAKSNSLGYSYSGKPSLPKPSDEKERLFTWIFYWPFCMAWKIIHKPIQRIFNQIMIWTETTYNQITENAFKKLEAKKEAAKKDK